MLFEYGDFDKDKVLAFDYGRIDPHSLARRFNKYFGLQYPLTLEQLLTICHESGFTV
jgi:hypothetical protein